MNGSFSPAFAIVHDAVDAASARVRPGGRSGREMVSTVDAIRIDGNQA